MNANDRSSDEAWRLLDEHVAKIAPDLNDTQLAELKERLAAAQEQQEQLAQRASAISGAIGAQGPIGPQGPKGVQGPVGVASMPSHMHNAVTSPLDDLRARVNRLHDTVMQQKRELFRLNLWVKVYTAITLPVYVIAVVELFQK